jgi:hypothetical protein
MTTYKEPASTINIPLKAKGSKTNAETVKNIK